MFAVGRTAKIFNGSVIPTYRAGPLNGKHKIYILCALCGSAVKTAFNFNLKCIDIYAALITPQQRHGVRNPIHTFPAILGRGGVRNA